MRHQGRCKGCVRPLARVIAASFAAAVLGASASACGSSTPTLPTSSSPGSTTATTAPHGSSTTPSTQASGSSTTSTSAATEACSISAVLEIAGESTSEDESRTSSWTLKQENNWTIFVPSSSWVISASTSGGADIVSPDGLSAANLGPIDSLSPVTYSEESQSLLSGVSNVTPVCQSENSVDANGESQAFEVTGLYKGEAVHIVYAITIAAVSPGSEFHGGEVRLIYGPSSQWSTSLAQELWLIIKRAIFAPSEG